MAGRSCDSVKSVPVATYQGRVQSVLYKGCRKMVNDEDTRLGREFIGCTRSV